MLAETTKFASLVKKDQGRQLMDPRIIVVEPNHNPRDYRLRENMEHVEVLKRSIQARGVLMPLLVRFDPSSRQPVLVDGESRLRAVMDLITEGMGIKNVPVIEAVGGSEPERLMTALTANDGKPLTKWEMGEAFRRLQKYGWSIDDMSRETGQTERFVREAIELSDVPDELKQAMSQGEVTPAAVLAEVRRSGQDDAVVAIQERVQAAKSVGQVAKRYKTRAVNLKKLVSVLMKDVTRDELNDESISVVGVDRKKLYAIAKALGIRGLKSASG